MRIYAGKSSVQENYLAYNCYTGKWASIRTSTENYLLWTPLSPCLTLLIPFADICTPKPMNEIKCQHHE